MSNSIPTTRNYWVAGIIGVVSLVVLGLGPVLGLVAFVRSFAAEAYLVVPGQVTFSVDQPGEWTISYEHQSVIDGQVYSSPEAPPAMNVRLLDGRGQEVELRTSTGMTYSTPNRAGRSLFRARLDEPGTYELSAELLDEADAGRQYVLAVQGPTEWRPLLVALGLGALGLAGLLVGAVLFFQTLSRRSRAARAYPASPPPPR